jgi:hypothetical protein
MRLALLSTVLFCIQTHVAVAQNTPTDDKNYKHFNLIHKKNVTTFGSDSITLRNQKTHKRHSKEYIVVPNDGVPQKNVQGQKNKANYKNQFN